MIYKKSNILLSKFSSKGIIILAAVFIILFTIFTLIKEQIGFTLAESSFFEKIIKISTLRLMTILYSMLGVFSLWLFVSKLTNNNSLPRWIIEFSTLSMGIYIYHQFLLKFLYYNTALPQLLGTYWLPWIGVISALLLSTFLAYITHRSRLGRLLIG